MFIRILNFYGIAPALSNRELPPEMAVVANNCYFTEGMVGPWREPKTIITPAKPGTKRTIYKMGQQLSLGDPDYDSKYWLHWTEDVDVVPGQIAGSSDEPTYFTGDTVSGKTNFTLALGSSSGLYPEVSYPLGVVAPTVALTATIQSGDGEGTAEDRYYIYTYVNSFGSALEESAPSPATMSPISVKDGQVVRVSGFIPPTSYGGNISHWRLYRTASGTQATDWQLVTEQPVSTTSFDDGVLNDELGEVIQSLDWNMPPENLRGLVNLPNGITVGFVGNDVYFSERYRPFTFPVKYSLTLDYKIVGLGVFGATLVAVTQGVPYIISGISPDSMSSEKMSQKQACVSKRSIVSMGFGVMYASPDGLVLVDSTGVNVVSQKQYKRRDWKAIKPNLITACDYEGRYLFWNDTQGFIFDLAQGVTNTDIYATAVHNDIRDDGLFMQVGNDIKKWDAGTALLPFTWKSKDFEMPRPINFGWAQVLVETGSLTIKFYADGVLKHTKTVSDDKAFRLPSGFEAKYWQFELSGTGSARGINVAQTMAELQNF
jgi:hypothetical protein